MQLNFFGKSTYLSASLSGTGSQGQPLPALLSAAEQELSSLAAAVLSTARSLGLDDYGAFQLAVAALDGLGCRLDEARALESPAHARVGGAWSSGSRLLAVAGLLRAMGYGAVPFGGPSALCLGVPCADEVAGLNVNRQEMNNQRSAGGVVTSRTRLVWLMWDGKGAVGAASAPGGAVLDATALANGPQGALHLASPVAPAFVRSSRALAELPLYGRAESLTYTQLPLVADYLARQPQRAFAEQSAQAMSELAELGLDRAVQQLAAKIPDETALVQTLLRTVQQQIRYTTGPLRSLHLILRDRSGDCDQRSMLLAAMLRCAGYRAQDLVTLRWADHLCLALRPHSARPQGQAIHVPGAGDFYALDAAFEQRNSASLLSAWGAMQPQYAAQPYVLGKVAPG